MARRRIKPLVLAFTAAVMAAVCWATAAQAETTAGPSYVVEEEVQGSGYTQEVTAADKTPFVLTDKTSKVKVECKGVKLKAGATLNGAEPNSAGTSNETLELSQCTGGGKEESLTGCEPEGGKLTTAALVNTLGFSNSSRTGELLVLFAPASGTTLASVKFSGEKCVTTSTTLTGKLIAEANSGGKHVEVGTNEVEAAKGELVFAAGEKTIWTESGGSLSSVKASLNAFGTEANLEGLATLELASKQLWGPFTQIELRKRAYSFGPASVLFNEGFGEERLFLLHNRGTEALEVRSLKIGGGNASKYAITDIHTCTIKTFTLLGACGVTIELLERFAGGATFEGLVLFGGGIGSGVHHEFRIKSLVND
jgi:hypothetical protein